MMRYKAWVLALFLLVVCGGGGLCMMLTDTFPAGQKMYPVSKTPQLPEELSRLYNLGNRVHGERDSFSEVGDTEKAYYTGDTKAFNEFLQQYVKVKIRPLKLIIHAGCAEVTTAGKNMIPYDWMLGRYLAGTKSMDPSGAEETVAVHLYPGCKVDLSKLIIPDEIEVTSGGELEKVVSDHREKRASLFEISIIEASPNESAVNVIESGKDFPTRPLLTMDDFVYYKWNEHKFKLTPEAEKKLPNQEVVGLPFAVIAGGTLIYEGAFWSSLSSKSFPYPVINVMMRSNGEYQIERAYPSASVATGPDPRDNPAIKEAFEKAGKLR